MRTHAQRVQMVTLRDNSSFGSKKHELENVGTIFNLIQVDEHPMGQVFVDEDFRVVGRGHVL